MTRTRSVTVTLVAPDQLPCAVDYSSVLRAVTNLIDNAVRYSPSNTTVEVEVTASDAKLSVAVIDHGPGIRSDNGGAIFQRFWRADTEQPGAGLGLPIARQIAEAHGGSISFTSPGRSGDGSRFELRLPVVGTLRVP